MIGNIGTPGGRVIRPTSVKLTPTSGLVLGLALSATLWAGAAELAHLMGIL